MPRTISRGIEHAGRVREVLVKPTPTAMVWAPAVRSFEEVAVPGVALAEGDVLVRVEMSTVCASDIAAVTLSSEVGAPVVLGHESVGRVAAVGGTATAECGTQLVEGMRVVWGATAGCGKCERCSRGLPELCALGAHYGHDHVHRGWELSGGFASHVHLLRRTPIVLVEESVPSTVAAPAACVTAAAVAAFGAALTHEVADGATIVIFGAGAVGLTVSALATDAGARVVLVDPDPERRSRGLDFGAVASVDPRLRHPAPRSLRGVLDTLRERGETRECVVAIDTTGHPDAFDSAVEAIAPGGLVVLVSDGAGQGARVIHTRAIEKQLSIAVASGRGGDSLGKAVRFLARAWPRYPFVDLVAETFDLGDVGEAVALASTRGAEAPRVALAVATLR